MRKLNLILFSIFIVELLIITGITVAGLLLAAGF